MKWQNKPTPEEFREWKHGHEFPQRPWRRRGGSLFFRMAFVFGFMTLMISIGIAGIGFIATNLRVGSQPHTPPIVWLIGLSILFPLIGTVVGRWARRRITNPLANIVDAAEKVSEGDLSVRIPEGRRSDFRGLSRSFNRMVAELENTDKLRRNMTADVAHELNTPLHILQGNLEGILDGVYEPTPEIIESMLDETHLLARLVDDLRTLSLAEAGELTLKLERLNMKALVDDLATSFSGQFESKDVAFHADISSTISLTADHDRIDQVLTNLTANALRYTPAGGEIEITAEEFEGEITVTIQDTGMGITAENLPFIFERFWRADKSRSHADGGGHGLGLAIAKQLIQAHGGQIEVESEIGQGTIFRIMLPK